MDIKQLTERAMEIRKRYAQFERTKFKREWTREQIMEGFVVDVGDLMKLVMAKNGIREISDLDRKLEHELADCLWCVLVLAKTYDIDIERAFLRTMDKLDGSIVTGKPASPSRRRLTRKIRKA